MNLAPKNLAPKNRAQRRALKSQLRALTPRRFRKHRRDGTGARRAHPALGGPRA
jgi:hypothetical protein